MSGKSEMTVASFNCNSVRARLPIIENWLAERKPDALALQETKVADEEFPVAEFARMGYHATFRGGKKGKGVAFLTREKPTDAAYGLDDGKDAGEDRLIRIMYRGWPIVNTYAPQGTSLDSPQYEYKLQWFGRLREFFARNYSPRRPLIWLGDINVAPDELDLARPDSNKKHVCFHPDARAALRNVMDWGFVDLFRELHEEAGEYTFWSGRFPAALKQNIGWRVDLILATRPAAEKCRECVIDKKPRLLARPSDHTPVLAVFAV